MKKLIAITLALGLTACSWPTLNIATDASRNTLYGVVNGYGVALSAETTYKNLCKQNLADANCKANVKRMQVADKRAITAIDNANAFIKEYPTVDAGNVISAASTAVDNFKLVTGAN